MRLSDELLPDYYRLVMESDVDPRTVDPMEAKLDLARFIVQRSHGQDAVGAAEAHFTRVVREGREPDDLPVVVIVPGVVHLPEFLKTQFGHSTSHWRRVIGQGGVKVNGEAIAEVDLASDPAQRGRRAGGQTTIREGQSQRLSTVPTIFASVRALGTPESHIPKRVLDAGGLSAILNLPSSGWTRTKATVDRGALR